MILTLSLGTPIPCEGVFEYLHRSPASRRRRRKVNPVPRGVTGPLFLRDKYGDLGLGPENDCAVEDQQQL
jgi:hypothetical protein